MDKLSEQDEKRYVDAVGRAIMAVNDGTDPNEALAKAASEEKAMPPIVQRMVEAYNVSSTQAHLKQASGADRAASFPVAETSRVLDIMYPAKPKAAEAAELQEKAAIAAIFQPARETEDFFKQPPAPLPAEWLKAAEAVPVDPEEAARRLFRTHDRMRKVATDATGAYQRTYTDMLGLAGKAAECFRRLDMPAFEDVEARVRSQYGDLGKSAMDFIHALWGGNGKRAAEVPKYPILYDETQMPYREIHAAIHGAQATIKAADAAAARIQELTEFELRHVDELPKLGKKAGIPGTAKDVMEVLGIGSDPTSTRQKTVNEVSAPGNEAQLRAIKVQAMMNDLLSNDSVLAGYDPKEVTSAYNQIAQMAPHVAKQPVLMRGLLRRIVQQGGVVEPHELTQLSDLEKAERQPALPLGGEQKKAPA